MMLTTSVSSSPAWASLSHLTASSYCRFSIRHWNHAGHVRLVKLARFILAHAFTCPVPHTHLTPHLPSTYICMTYTRLTPLCPPHAYMHTQTHDTYNTHMTFHAAHMHACILHVLPPPPPSPPLYQHTHTKKNGITSENGGEEDDDNDNDNNYCWCCGTNWKEIIQMLAFMFFPFLLQSVIQSAYLSNVQRVLFPFAWV